MAGYKLTVRRGSDVSRGDFAKLGDAVDALRREAESVRSDGPLPEVKMIRSYEPEKRVAARLEISSGGMLGGETAGVDVMGDGRVVPFRGGMFRRELEPAGSQSAYDAVKRALK